MRPVRSAALGPALMLLVTACAGETNAPDPAYDACLGKACGEGCDPCDPRIASCTHPESATFCDAAGACRTGPSICPVGGDGWNAPPGSGTPFIVSSLAIAGAGSGFDLDGLCKTAGSCLDNKLAPLGDLMNDQLRQALLGGETLELLELAGLSAPYDGMNDEVTVKLYAAKDADDPFFPANNFAIPPGHSTCCEFVVPAPSLAAPVQAGSRMPAKITKGNVGSSAPVVVDFPSIFGTGTSLQLGNALLAGQLAGDLTRLEGAVGGAATLQSLAETRDPYCQTVNSSCRRIDQTMLDRVLVLGIGQPDIDLDGDGLETVEDTDDDGLIDVCRDGCAGACAAPEVVPPVDPTDPSSCVYSPRMADGYSVAFAVSAVRAKITTIEAPAVDPSGVALFYPVDGLVYLRVSPTALGGYPVLDAHPTTTGGHTFASAKPEADFTLALPAAAGEHLELTGRSHRASAWHGLVVTATVPDAPAPQTEYVCCQPTGTCQPTEDAAAGHPCPTPASGATTCQDERGCEILNHVTVLLDPEAVNATAPVDGVVSLQPRFVGELPGNALVRAHLGAIERLTVTSSVGAFQLSIPAAHGDVVRVTLYKLDGDRSRPLDVTVP